MSTDRNTQPSEIPTALIEEDPFEEDSQTIVEDPTQQEIERTGESGPTPSVQRFRRPTKSEIARAVDEVRTEAVDISELAKARKALQDENPTADVELPDT